LRAAEEQTGHNYNTMAGWIKRLGDHAEGVTEVLTHDVNLSKGEVDELLRPFAFLWTGQTVSRVGDGIYRIALAWWVLEATDSAAAMGTVLIA
jgi:hypothetical protein